jgi:histidyl-tRNA synthetase
MKAQMKAADRNGARYAVIIAEAENQSGTATIRALGTGAQIVVRRDELVRRLQGSADPFAER